MNCKENSITRGKAAFFRKELIFFIGYITHKIKNTDDMKALDTVRCNNYPFLCWNILFITYFNPLHHKSMLTEYYFIRQQFFEGFGSFFELKLIPFGYFKK